MPDASDPLADLITEASAGLRPLIAAAQAAWRARAVAVSDGCVEIAAAPGWRSFEDAFPTFYQFTNRPR